MMGQTTLAEIRQRLWQALEATGEDPIEWLEKRIAQNPKSVVLKGLYGFLKRKLAKKRRTRRAAVKK